MQGARQDLLRDVECYTCGEVPSAMEMIRAPRLDAWEVGIRRRGKEFIMVVDGVVSKHPEIEDGQVAGSGALVWFDRHARFVRSHKRLWVLGWKRDCEGLDLPEGS